MIKKKNTKAVEKKDLSHCVYFILQKKKFGFTDIFFRRTTKIGRTKNISRRLQNLQTGNPRKLFVYRIIPDLTKDEAVFLEKSLHCKYVDVRIKNSEWFKMRRRERNCAISFGNKMLKICREDKKFLHQSTE